MITRYTIRCWKKVERTADAVKDACAFVLFLLMIDPGVSWLKVSLMAVLAVSAFLAGAVKWWTRCRIDDVCGEREEPI